MWKSLATMVATPRKWPGREAPSRRSEMSATSTNVVERGWGHLGGVGGEEEIDAGNPELAAVFVEGAGGSG